MYMWNNIYIYWIFFINTFKIVKWLNDLRNNWNLVVKISNKLMDGIVFVSVSKEKVSKVNFLT